MPQWQEGPQFGPHLGLPSSKKISVSGPQGPVWPAGPHHAVAPPEVGGLVVPGGVRVAGEHGHGELLPFDSEDLGQELVAPGDGLLLEVVPEGPVAQHLEEREVAGVADLVDVPCPDALLEVGQPPSGGVLLAEEVGYQRVHPRGGEQNGGVVLGYEGGGADLRVAPLLEEVDVGLSHLLSFHGAHSCKVDVGLSHLLSFHGAHSCN